MALPVQISSLPGCAGHHPPYKSSAGAFYVVVLQASGTHTDVVKTTDPTTSWGNPEDVTNGPVHAQTVLGLSSVQDGDVIHIVAWGAGVIEYYTFNMATDLWVVDENVETTADDATNPWASIARRSGATIICYAGDTDQVMGGKKERVDYAIRPDSSGTWDTVGAALDAGGDIHYGNPNCILGTNNQIHFIWQTTSNTADPPTAWTDTEGRTLDSSDDSLSTTDSSDADTGANLLGYTNLVTYDDAGTQRIIANGYQATANTTLSTAQGTEDGSDDLVLVATGLTETITAGYTNGEVNIATFGVDGTDIHGLYAGGGTAGADQDLYYHSSTDDGASWSAATEEIDAVTINYIAGNVYTRGAATVFAYLYDQYDLGDDKQFYNEYVIDAGASGETVLPTLETIALTGYVPLSIVSVITSPTTVAMSLGVAGSAPTVSIGEIKLPLLGTVTFGETHVPTVTVFHIRAPPLDELDLTGNVPLALVANNTSALLGGLSFDGDPITSSLGAVKQPALDELALSSDAPTAIHDRVSDVPLATLALGEQTPVPIQGQVEQPLLGTLALGISGSEPEAIIANVREPSTDALALGVVGSDPTASVGDLREPGTDALVLGVAGSDVTIIHNRVAAPTTVGLALGEQTSDPIQGQIELPLLGALSLDGKIPVTSVGELREPGLDTLVLASDEPSAIVSNVVAPGLDELDLAGKIPTLGPYDNPEIPGTDSLAFSSDVITVTHDRVTIPDTVSLDFTGYAPTRADITIEPGTVPLRFIYVIGLKLEGQPLTIDVAGGDNTELPLLGELDLTGTIPTTIVANNIPVPLASPSPTITGYAPTIVQAQVELPLLGTLALGIAGSAPSAIIANVTAPTTKALTLGVAGSDPTASVDDIIEPDTVGLSLDGKLPIVSGVGTIEVPTGSLNIYKYIGLKLDGFPPTPVINTPVLPTTIGLSLSGQNVTLDAAVSPSTIGLSLSGTTPTLDASVLPTTGSLELDGYQLADQDAIIVPVGALSLDGKLATLRGVTSPTTGSLTISPLSPTSDYQASPDVSLGSIAFSSDAPSAVQSHITAPGTVALSLDGKIPLRFVDTAGSSTRVPKEAELTLSGQSAAVKDLSTVDPLGVSLSLSGSIPTVDVSKDILVPTGGLNLYSDARETGSTTLSLAGQTVTIWYRDGTLIENPDADNSIISNIEECDYSGFKVMPGSLKMTWNRYAVRQKSYEDRHPADFPHRTHTQRKRGPQRPEPSDTFLDYDVDPGDL